jgi:hypothetical protein
VQERSKTWHSVSSHSGRDLLFALEAAFWLVAMRAALFLVPFRLIAPHLGDSGHETPAELTAGEMETARRISWAVQAVAHRLSLVCLPQALAAKAMLRMRRIASTLYLGVHLRSRATISAHAWLRCGPLIVTGQPGARTNVPVACFGERN